MGWAGLLFRHNFLSAVGLSPGAVLDDPESVDYRTERIMYSLSHRCIHGPLKTHEAGFREWLAEHGCCVPSVRYQLELMDDLSRWLTRHGAGPGELTPAVVSEVLAARRARGHHLGSARGAGPLLGYLRGLGVVPGAARPAARTPRERLMEEYRSYLASERGLAEGTTGLHLRAAAMFLAGIPDPLSEGLRDLSAGQVTGIVSRGVRQCAVSTARGRASCVRVLLRFLFVTGQVPRDLAPAVPSVAGWRLASLPRRLDTAWPPSGFCAGRRTAAGIPAWPGGTVWSSRVKALAKWAITASRRAAGQ